MNAIFSWSSCQFYGACKNKQGLWHKKSHVNRINGWGVMPQKHNSFVLWAAQATKKTFYFLTFLGWIFS
jgi:hypothetical protein